MTPLAIAALILAVVLATYLIWTLNAPAVRTTVGVVEKLRLVIGILFLTLAAWHLLRSGNPLYVALAMLGFAFLTAYALVERPWQNTI